jgi:hypothetical protein
VKCSRWSRSRAGGTALVTIGPERDPRPPLRGCRATCSAPRSGRRTAWAWRSGGDGRDESRRRPASPYRTSKDCPRLGQTSSFSAPASPC